MKRLLPLLLLCSCATPPSDRAQAEFASAYGNFQMACMAAEMDDSAKKECVKAEYHLCRVAYKMQKIIWYTQPWTGRSRRGDGYPNNTLEMKMEMNNNNCRPKL